MEKLHKATPVSLGIAIGKVLKYNQKKNVINRYTLSPDDISGEIIRFNNAVSNSYEQISEIKNKIQDTVGQEYSRIFDAHLLLLQDNFFLSEIIERIKNERINCEFVLNEALGIITESFNSLDNEIFRQRATDIVDVGRRILQNLNKYDESFDESAAANHIIIAEDLFPSDTLLLSKKNIIGFITERGGVTSHTSILARAMNVPALVKASEAQEKFIDGETLVIDAFTGTIIQNPSPETLKKYTEKKSIHFETEKRLLSRAVEKCISSDGVKINFFANIEIPDEISETVKYGAEGIGLFRTEFIFIDKVRFPSENEQFLTYKHAVENLPPDYPLVIRTIDIGGDKLYFSNKNEQSEANPFLGLRAIRYCLQNRDIFKTQLRAILKASAFGNVRLLIPMVSFINEIVKTREIIEEVKFELNEEEIEFDNNIKIGIMIEIPAAALLIEEFLKFSDFVSIGTNDLIQYTLAVDRGNDKVGYLFQRLHPAVLHLIHKVITICKKSGKEVSVCGDMAEIPSSAIILSGMGLTNFSMTPYSIPDIKMILSNISIEAARKYAEDIMNMHLIYDIKKYIIDNIKPIITNILPSYQEADQWMF